MKITALLRLFKDLYKHKNVLMQKFAILKSDEQYKKTFVQKFGFFPEALKYQNIDMLELGENASIGDYNKIIYTETRYPISTKPTKVHLGKNVWTGTGVELNVLTGSQIIIKAYSSIQDRCKLIGDVVIERYCIFAPNIFVSSGNHYALQNEPTLIRNQDSKHLNNELLLQKHSKKVHIEEDCWIGIGTFIRQGIYIGRGAVIGANACITKDVLPYSIVVGNNKTINSRISFKPLMEIDASKKEHLPYFYRGFMQRDDERIDYNSFALYEDEAILVLQKADCKRWSIEGKIEGNLNNVLVVVTINKTLEFEHIISESNFKMVCDLSNAKKNATKDDFLTAEFNVIELKIVGYKFSRNNFISINKLIQSL